ncbi:hypothetical protein [Pseudomonas amygdali]
MQVEAISIAGRYNYLQQVGVILVVGGSVALATAAWQVFGTGVPG